MVTPRVEGAGDAPEHTHPVFLHRHDHYHVTHYHKSGITGEGFDHRPSWHAHDHNHNELAHSHDYSVEDEETDHDKEAHTHDHAPLAVVERPIALDI